MYKKVIIIACLLFSINNYSQIETIDKIGQLVIPLIEKIFKPNQNKQEKQQAKNAKNELPEQIKNAISKLQSDSEDLKRLHEIFKVSNNLFDDVGAMETITDNFFLDTILKVNSQGLNKKIALSFKDRYDQLKKKQKNLQTASEGSPANSLGEKIYTFNEELGEHLTSIESKLSTVPKATESMTNDQAKLHVQKLKELRIPIDRIKNQIKSINRALVSYIASMENDFKQIKVQADKVGNTKE